MSKIKMPGKCMVILLWLIIALNSSCYSEDVNTDKYGEGKENMQPRSKRSDGLLANLCHLTVEQKIERTKLIKDVEEIKKELQNQADTKSMVKEMKKLKREFQQLKHELKYQKNEQKKRLTTEIQKVKKTIRDNNVKVSFNAVLTKHLTLGKGSIVPYDQLFHNEGNGFNVNKGVFHCPIDGVYMISASLEVFNTRVISILMKNGSTIGAMTKGSPSNAWNSNSVTVVTRLRKGDRVWVQNYYKAEVWGISYFSGVWISK
nr:complement C1q domain-containing protein 1 [Anadara sativa]